MGSKGRTPQQHLAERGQTIQKTKVTQIDLVTIFPEFFTWPLSNSLLKRAEIKRKVKFRLYNPRDYTKDRHRTVDEKPFGGGAGMVFKPEPLFKCVESISPAKRRSGSASGGKKGYVVLLSPRGKKLTQTAASRLARKKHLILICGHYEGVDERVSKKLADEEISVGDFVTMGGEAPALCLIESVVRLLPGVLGNPESLKEESFSGDGLEFPQYTRPRVFRGLKVPAVLLSGNHQEIKAWRHEQSLQATQRNRPDLLERKR